jgi:Tfp pilus assembly protein PilP
MTVMTRAIRFTMAAGVLALMAVMPSNAAAQIQVGTKVGTAPPPTSAGAGTYESLGRRDPFVTLIAPRRAAPNAVAVPRSSTGLGSFLLADVTVTGLVRYGNQMTAIIQGADKMSYVAKPGAKLADAVIKSIDKQGVVFVDIPHPGTGARPQETRKLLRQVSGDNR